VLAAAALVAGSPGLDLPIIRQINRLAGRPIAVASPGLLAPAIRQIHFLDALDLATGGIGMDLPKIGLRHYVNIGIFRGYMPAMPIFNGRSLVAFRRPTVADGQTGLPIYPGDAFDGPASPPPPVVVGDGDYWIGRASGADFRGDIKSGTRHEHPPQGASIHARRHVADPWPAV
jgi:hypothetical protein